MRIESGPARHGQQRAYVERLLQGKTPHNGATARAVLSAKAAEGAKVATLKNHAITLSKYDRHLNGADFLRWTVEGLQGFVLALTTRHAPNTVDADRANLRHFYNRLYDGAPPRDLWKALRRHRSKEFADIRPIETHEFEALLAAAAQERWPLHRLRLQALLWTLWDSGFRIGELCSMRIDGVEFDDRGGARLRLRRGSDGLKTGARTIYVVECVAHLRAWLALHPEAGRPDAFLFPKYRGRMDQPMWPTSVNQTLRRLCKTAGVRHVYPHLFRHSRATRAARAGWVEAQMRDYFGWSRNSDMPSVYIHLNQQDMEERVRRDAGLTTAGLPAPSASVDDAALEARLRKALRKMLMEDA